MEVLRAASCSDRSKPLNLNEQKKKGRNATVFHLTSKYVKFSVMRKQLIL